MDHPHKIKKLLTYLHVLTYSLRILTYLEYLITHLLLVLFVLCFGVEFLCCLNLMYVFIVLVRFG